MSDLRWTIEPTDIEWLMRWSKCSGMSKTEDEMVFEDAKALAFLLLNEVVFINNYWWDETKKGTVSLHVNCNDLFMWACTDSEDLKHEDIEPIYKAFISDPVWGVSIWCCKRRNMQPQAPIRRSMKNQGVWTEEMEALPKNPDDKSQEDKG